MNITVDELEAAYMLKLFRRLEDECPQFFRCITHDGAGWYLTDNDVYLTDNQAAKYLTGICFGILPAHWHETVGGGFGVYRLENQQIRINPCAPSLVNAMLMSVGLAHGHGW